MEDYQLRLENKTSNQYAAIEYRKHGFKVWYGVIGFPPSSTRTYDYGEFVRYLQAKKDDGFRVASSDTPHTESPILNEGFSGELKENPLEQWITSIRSKTI